ncbi:MAG: hypothetical protein CMM46_02785 [Rhodospirillaceae bacterium]|nr:hypothetical protein [Rhodospirillaceae bacterium]|tara:strand:- start:1290 stop:1745 length:456 start_codon:yes stop_codon:yes gene_type:complete
MLDTSAAWRRQRETVFAEQAPESLGALLDRAGAEHGDAVAIDLFERGTTMSYAQWRDRSLRLASGFDRLGIKRGMHVGVLLQNVVEFPLTWLALARVGTDQPPLHADRTPLCHYGRRHPSHGDRAGVGRQDRRGSHDLARDRSAGSHGCGR